LSLEKIRIDLQGRPLLIVISGSSGVGKDATITKLKESGFRFHHVTTVTTRPKRPGEIDKIDYHFISEEQFQQMVKKGEFLEWAQVYSSHYGVPKEEIKKALKAGEDVIVRVDVQGASTIKRITPDAILIFLLPPSIEELPKRLEKRSNQPLSDLDVRLRKVYEEMKSLPIFDYAVVNHKDNLNLTASQINAIVTAEKCRPKPRIVKL